MERDRAIVLANRILDRPWGDPDDDLAILSRQLLRSQERIEALEAQLSDAMPPSRFVEISKAFHEHREALEARLAAAEAGITSLFEEIKHGDQAHQDWLRNKIDEHFAAWRRARGLS